MKKEKQLTREELEAMPIFNLKHIAVNKVGIPQSKVKQYNQDTRSDLIDEILEKLGEEPTAKKGKKEPPPKKGKKKDPEPEPEEDDDPDDGDDGDDGDGEDGDGEDEDDGDGEDGDGEDGEDADEPDPPPTRAKAPAKSKEKSLDEAKLDALIDGIAQLRADVAEVKSDFDGIGRYVMLIWAGVKAGLLRIGKTVGTKNLKSRLEALEKEHLEGAEASEDD